MPDTTPTVTSLPAWVLERPVDITLVSQDASRTFSMYLVQKADGRDALVLTFDDDQILINGNFVDLGDDMIAVCSIIDDTFGQFQPPRNQPMGVTLRSEPYNWGICTEAEPCGECHRCQ